MTTENIDYAAVLADLEARRAKIDTAIEAVKGIIAALGIPPSGSQRVVRPQDIPSDAFFTLTIADAAKKYLGMVKSKQSTEQIRQALEAGGLPPTKYESVSALLRRRAASVGDIVRVGDDWGLAEWYPNNPTIKRRSRSSAAKSQENGGNDSQPKVSGTTQTKPGDSAGRGAIKMIDAVELILRDFGKPTHISLIVGRLADEYGKFTNARSLSGALPQDGKKRFKNLGRNVWVLTEWPQDVIDQGRKENTLPL